MQFTKLFSCILDSTIWQEPPQTKILWITMLAMSDRNGEVHASVPGLAKRAGITLEECERGIACLMAPDPYSRTKDHDGRRVGTIDGGWALLNHAKYRALLSAEERREYNRQKQAEHRAKQRASANVNDSQSPSALSAHTEAESEAEADKTIPPTPQGGELSLSASPESEAPTKPPLLRRVEKLFGRTERRKLSAGEIRAWRIGQAVVAETTDEEWAILEWWFALPDERAPYRKTDMAACLNNWHAEIAKARRNKGQAPIGTPVEPIKPRIPDNLRDEIPE